MVALKYLFDCVLVAYIDKCHCNSKYSDLYEHYVNSVKLVVNNRFSIIDNMLSGYVASGYVV